MISALQYLKDAMKVFWEYSKQNFTSLSTLPFTMNGYFDKIFFDRNNPLTILRLLVGNQIQYML